MYGLKSMSARKALVEIGRHAFSLLISTLGVWFSSGLLVVFLAPILGGETARGLALRPPYPLLVGVGIVTGYASELRWRRLFTPWVWILPALYLMSGIVTWLQTGYTLRDSVRHFIGDCWPLCQDQYQWTCPLYSSLAFSLGVLLRKLRGPSVDA